MLVTAHLQYRDLRSLLMLCNNCMFAPTSSVKTHHKDMLKEREHLQRTESH